MAPKKATTGKNKIEKPPPTEVYDYSRTQTADPRDPRTVGPPCLGHHKVQPPGPGSKTGSNKFAIWEACEKCHLRLSCTPAYGATGASRKAGPLDRDTAQAISKIPTNELTGNRNLKNEKISLDGAENSLLKKLENVQKKKAEWEQSQKSKDTETKGYEPDPTAAMAKAKASVVTSTVRKARKPEETAEDLESTVISVGDQEDDWTPIPIG